MKKDLESKLLIDFDDEFQSDELGLISVEFLSETFEIDDDLYAYGQSMAHS